jgi:sigma-B regulation protein RsbU (phosphoserine phosphatase)
LQESGVPNLTDYISLETLQQLQDTFTAVGQVRIRICDASGEPLTLQASQEPPNTASAGPAHDDVPPARGVRVLRELPAADAAVPVLLDNEVVGRVSFEDSDGSVTTPRHLRLLGLVAGVISRLAEREQQLRWRAEQLGLLYKITAEFTGQRDLQSVLDTVARTVVDTMHARGCAIRLLSDDRSELTIKAVANLSKEYLAKGPILVARSQIDSEVLSTGKPLYIADERTDPRVLYPAEARREGIVSALVVPMIYRGRAEGIIRVYMADRHEFDWFEMTLIQAIAAEGAAAIMAARLNAEAMVSADIQRQLRLAGEVQRRMIPAEAPKMEGFDVATIYVPCFQLGGDFYDFIRLGNDNVGLSVCDVSGKGVRASLLTASIRASLRAHASNIYDMSTVMERVNRDLCADTLSSDFATLFYGVLDTTRRRLTYTNAGHVPPILVRGESCSELSTGGPIIGIDEGLQWQYDMLDLQRGDVLLLYTDGLIEAMNFEDEMFGLERAKAAVRAAAAQAMTAEGVAKHVLWEMRRFAGLSTRLDDLTLIALRVV